ncbi:rhomboid family intramembrane serine protease [Streptomyces bohaiensis]|uniref:Rhomboid family intramembrane serine protease n=1 Tax=Streptomyces bohaiensis TaxID=1431344 RepID=A0ABX1C7E6_9ACTN|nr:rhomboid family intramembrane serine protease [Streptomyces bohaiensis]NJQ13873.1 rhomboid family intramembrane serine protease [Streptomyces bohaiensis]
MTQHERQPGLSACFRHPERDTGIHCTRCERPICPDCMIDAAVGYQCPECVRQGAAEQAATQPRTIAGGRLRTDTRLVTLCLIGVNLAVFVGLKASEYLGGGEFGLIRDFAMLGYAWAPGSPELMGVATGEWYRLLTSAFMHQAIFHIAFNMFALWFLGPNLEAALGRGRFLALYLISALAGSTASFALAAQNQFSLGASGAVFGLFGALAVLLRKLRYDMRPVLVLLAVNLVITFLPGLNIAWQAHLGGLVAGAAIAYGMVHAPRRNRTAYQVGVCVLVLLVLVGVCVARTLQLT